MHTFEWLYYIENKFSHATKHVSAANNYRGCKQIEWSLQKT